MESNRSRLDRGAEHKSPSERLSSPLGEFFYMKTFIFRMFYDKNNYNVMEIVKDKISASKLKEMAEKMFGKAVAEMPVDVEKVLAKIKRKNFMHEELSAGRWQKFSFIEQMANVGAEIGRAINWREKDKSLSQAAFYRGLELLDLTIEDKKNKNKLKELCRLREIIADYFCFDNVYKSTDEKINNYFYLFGYAAASR